MDPDAGFGVVRGRWVGENDLVPDPYDLIPLKTAPDAPEGVVVRDEAEDAIEAAATDMFLHATNCVRAFGDVHIALSGGRTPTRLYQQLMLDPQYRSFPWKRTHLWSVNEPGRRCPSAASEVLVELIADHSDLPREQLHLIDTDSGPRAYAAKLREVLGWREPGHDRLDYVLLGVGEDGSTAGLAAGEAPPSEPLVHRAGPADDEHVTLGLRLINASRFIAVLALGREKHEAVSRSVAGGSGSRPIDQVRPVGGVLRWYVDSPAITGATP
ncbi:MAG: 6-phosphogluconolactonase [Planctomycetota bacterium]